MQAKWAARGGGTNAGIGCDALLDLHTDYVDGRLKPLDQLRVRAHLAACDACARYDRIVRQAGELLDEMPEVEVSSDFGNRLRRRLVATGPVERDPARRAPGRPIAAAVLMAGALGLAALSGAFGPTRPASSTDALAGGTAAPTDGATIAGLRAGPDAGVSLDVHRPTPRLFRPAVARTASARESMPPLFVRVSTEYATTPGPYSPLVVMSPALRSAIASGARRSAE